MQRIDGEFGNGHHRVPAACMHQCCPPNRRDRMKPVRAEDVITARLVSIRMGRDVQSLTIHAWHIPDSSDLL